MTKPKLLIVDDDEGIRTQLKYALRDQYALSFAGSRAEALAQLREAQPVLVSLDLGLPPSPDTADEGFKTLEEILGAAPQVKVIVMTGNTDRQNALRAVQLGAFDYHLKPIALDEYKVVLGRAAFLHTLAQETEAASRAEEQASQFEEILGTTRAIREIFAIVERVAKTDATVLIAGESGTGKELVARAIHSRSGRRDGPFVAVNCAAIAGDAARERAVRPRARRVHRRARRSASGLFELADGGTLFLDEIGEMPLAAAGQAPARRSRSGRSSASAATTADRVDVAGHRRHQPRPRRRRSTTGRFREDLYYRLSVVAIERAAAARAPRGHRRCSPSTSCSGPRRRTGSRRAVSPATRSTRCCGYHWPGNVRELENRVSRAVIMARGTLIEPADLDLQPAELEPASSLRAARERVEREALVETLSRHRGNISKAARSLKVSRPTLHGLLDKHRIDASTFR